MVATLKKVGKVGMAVLIKVMVLADIHISKMN